MRKAITFIAGACLSTAVFGQQSSTDCRAVGSSVHCDTRTQSSPDMSAPWRLQAEGQERQADRNAAMMQQLLATQAERARTARQQRDYQSESQADNYKSTTLSSGSALRTGNDLYAICKLDELSCLRYIQGIVDGSNIMALFPGSRPVVCFPDGATVGQARDVVIQSLERLPQVRQRPAADFVLGTLSVAFPCAK